VKGPVAGWDLLYLSEVLQRCGGFFPVFHHWHVTCATDFNQVRLWQG
jgi:hypothetical protein